MKKGMKICKNLINLRNIRKYLSKVNPFTKKPFH